jgi:glycosyl transferase, family 25
MRTKAFLINLDRDADRLEYMSRQLRELNVPFERVRGILGAELPDWLNLYFNDENGIRRSDMMNGEVGCYASHLHVMKMISEMGEPAIVLEDDVRLEKGFDEALHEALPADLDMLKLCSNSHRATLPIQKLPSGRKIVKYARVPLGTGAYLVTPQGAKKFVDWSPIRVNPIDQDLRRPWSCKMRIYGVHPPPCIQNQLPSTLLTFGAPPIGRRFYRHHYVVERYQRLQHDMNWLGAQNWIRLKVYESLDALTSPERGA